MIERSLIKFQLLFLFHGFLGLDFLHPKIFIGIIIHHRPGGSPVLVGRSIFQVPVTPTDEGKPESPYASPKTPDSIGGSPLPASAPAPSVSIQRNDPIISKFLGMVPPPRVEAKPETKPPTPEPDTSEPMEIDDEDKVSIDVCSADRKMRVGKGLISNRNRTSFTNVS